MKKLFPLFIALLVFTNFCFAQSTVQKLFSVDCDASYKSIQSLFPKIKFTEKIFSNLREIYFNETINSTDVKIGFFFNNNKELKTKAINNLGKDARSGQKFFEVFKNYAVEHFGDKYEFQKGYSAFVITWNLGTDAMVMLSYKDERSFANDH